MITGVHQYNNGEKPFGQQAFERSQDGRWTLVRKKNFYKCSVLWCKRVKGKRKSLCNTCYSREWRANHPIQYAYTNLKRHARQRRIKFTLTFKQFKTFIQQSNYITARGNRQPTDLQIDRIDNTKGYRLDNIQVITFEENRKKQNTYDYPPHREKQMECPF